MGQADKVGGARDGGIDDGGGCRLGIVCKAAIRRAGTRDGKIWSKGLLFCAVRIVRMSFGGSIKESWESGDGNVVGRRK